MKQLIIPALLCFLTACSSAPAPKPAPQPLTPEQQAAREAMQRANAELLRKNNEAFEKARAEHPEAMQY